MRRKSLSRLILGIVIGMPLVCSADERELSFRERFLYGGTVTANFSAKDPGYFNDIEYRRNGMRLLRLDFALEFRASDRVSILTEIRSDNLDAPRPYALYVRYRPFVDRPFDVQAGRIPPVFGAFSRRGYDYDNPLIGYPLAYQYPTLMRSDSAPETLSELLRQRGRGANVWYRLGDPSFGVGLPLVNPLRWDTGVQVKLGGDPLELGVALTQGTVSSPRVEDDNSGKQFAGRLGWRPAFGWEVGFSGARGDYLGDEVEEASPLDGRRNPSYQTSFGFDLEFARGYWLLRAESIWSRWDLPTLATGSVRAFDWMVEARYKFTPGLYVAARIDRLTFDRIDTPGGILTWDAPVSRLEAGLGYKFHRRLLAKLTLQYNERDGGPRTSATIPAVQLLFWF